MVKLKAFIYSVFLVQSFLVPGSVFADIGPKPSMDFDFQFDSTVQVATILSGILYECEQPDCSDAAPLEEIGPQRFYCDTAICHATAYGFRPYHRLEIQFSNGITRQSNVFETAGFDSKYTVTVLPEDLLVEAKPSLNVVPPKENERIEKPVVTSNFIQIIRLAGCLCTLCIFGGLGLLAGVIILLVWRSATT